MSKPLCVLPWYQMVLYPGGGFRPCCKGTNVMDENIPLIGVKSSKEIFNSREMVRLRKALLSGNLEGTVCMDCCPSNYETTIPEEFYSLSLPDDYLRSYLEEISTFPLVIGRPPLSIWMQMSKKCNLNCIMCIQKPLKASDKTHFPVAPFIKMVEQDGLDKFAVFLFWGGEPLYCDDGINLLDYFSVQGDNKLFSSFVVMISNGTQIIRQAHRLSKIKNVVFNFSVDAIGERYETIRKGAKFSQLVNGINWYKENFPDCWKHSSVNCVVMKSNVMHLDEVIGFCDEIGLGENCLSFTPIQGCHEENFLENVPLIIDENFIPTCFKNVELAKTTKQFTASRQLEEIVKAYEEKISKLITPAKDTRIAIYGTGKRAKELERLISCYRKDLRVQFNIDHHHKTDMALRIVNVNELEKYIDGIDSIVIASAYYVEICKKLQAVGCNEFSIY